MWLPVVRLTFAILTCVLWITPQPVAAQEVCGNCRDDEPSPDGVAECYDPECRSNPVCAGSYVGNNPPFATCGIAITLEELWRAPRLVDIGMASIGDIDGDGMPEVVFQYHSEVRVLSGLDGSEEAGNVRNWQGRCPAIADIDRDGDAEIFVGAASLATPTYSMARLTANLATVWSTANTGGPGFSVAYASPSIADFDQDGNTEVYLMGFIVDAADGRLIVDVSSEITATTTSYTIAADVLPDGSCATCAGLELVTSYGVYAIDLATGSYSLEVILPSQPRGTLAVVDWDGDQQLDVVTLATTWPIGGSGLKQVSVWNPRLGTNLSPIYTLSGFGSASAPAVADFDGDGELEVALVTCDGLNWADPRFLRILDHDMSVLHNLTVAENSEWTSVSAFDFDCDGIPELVHRGTEELRIYSGVTGTVIASAPCVSGTNTERVMIADINADGHTDIVSGCEVSQNYEWVAWTVPDSPPARRVLNQFNYFNVHIDDDLTVPCRQQNHADDQVNRQLNSFLTQAPFFDAQGRSCVYPTSCLCGNATVDPGEECDDGNTVDGDGCQSTCLLPRCGDGIIDSGEMCDDANVDPADLCALDCTLTICGDGIVQVPNGAGSGGPIGDGHEECDDGNGIPGDRCSDCRIENCVAAAMQPIRLLIAIKSPDDLSVILTHTPDPSADGYNTWYVSTKAEIPRARLGDLGVAPPGCNPSATSSCWHFGAVAPTPTGPLLYYQVRGVCGSTEAAE